MNTDVRKRGLRVWCLSLVVVLVDTVSAQVLVTECIHRDRSGRVIYLEREYREGDTSLYLLAHSDGGRTLRAFSAVRGDTLVEYSQCFELDPSDIGGHSWVVGSEEYLEYQERRRDYAGKVHRGERDVDWERAVLRETYEYRSLRGRTIGKLITDGKGQVTNRQTFEYGMHGLVAWSYFDEDTNAYAVDSISWSVDSTAMRVVNRWLNAEGDRYEWSVRFAGDTSIFSTRNEQVVDYWLYDRTPWNVRTREAALREGPLCYSRIQVSRECLLKESRASNGKKAVSKHQ